MFRETYINVDKKQTIFGDMKSLPCRERVFPMQLAEFYIEHYRACLRWLSHLLERLGEKETLRIWQKVFQEQTDPMLHGILSEKWQPVPTEARIDVSAAIDSALADVFPGIFQGVDAASAQRLVDGMLPFSVILKRCTDLNLVREITSYEAFHLQYHGLALLTEALIEIHGRRGELIAYDANILASVVDQDNRLPPGEYLVKKHERFKRGYEEPDINTAALERHIVRGNDKELVWQVRECEWAHYFKDRHPRVGSLLACSKDHAEYGSFNDRIRLQLTSTIMEGARVCNFRLYAVDENAGPQVIRAVNDGTDGNS